MKRVVILLGIVLTFSSVSMARTLSVDEARSAAARFVLSNAPTLQRSPSANFAAQLSVAYTSPSTTVEGNALYVFNIANDGGYIVASADDCAPDVLGYSDNGTFDYATLPDNARWWIDEYARQISYMQSLGGTYAPRRVTLPKSISILMPNTHWTQRSPFNDNVPVYEPGQHCKAGCVAIAMGQIMYFHKWPNTGKGTHTYKTIINNEGDSITRTRNFANSSYEWTKILGQYTNSSSATSRQAVAKVVDDVGFSVSMTYGASSSGASSRNVALALTNYFDYDKSMIQYERDYIIDDTEWDMLIYNELQKGRPVYYSGKTQSSGHAFVVDGCKTDGYFHVNWGWGGTSDGYFLSTAMTPQTQGDGGSNGGYNSGQTIITGIRKNAGGANSYYGYLKSTEYTDASVALGNSTILKLNRYNVRTSTGENTTVYIGFGVYDSNDNLLYFSTSKKHEGILFGYVYTWNANLTPQKSLSNGQYKVKAGFTIDGSTNFQPFHVNRNEKQYITMTVNNNTATFSFDPVTPIEQPLFGDINGDNFVNVTDINLLVSAVLTHRQPLGYDLNGDGEVNVTDINLCVSAALLNK